MKTLREYLEEKEGLVNNPSELDVLNKICWKLWNNKNKKFIRLLVDTARKDEELKEDLKRLFDISHFEIKSNKEADYITPSVADKFTSNDETSSS